MKIGFSSLVCPGWNLSKMVEKAAEMSFDGIEIRGLQGDLNLPMCPELAGDPSYVRGLCKEHGVELVCLGCSATLDSRHAAERGRQKGEIANYLELAGALGCPFVRIFAGEVQGFDNLRAAQARIAATLIDIIPIAQRNGVTLLVENGGDFCGSEALWFMIDAVDHPAVRVCWNQLNARMIGERATTSLPRLGGKIALAHIGDADFDARGFLTGHKPLGEGDLEVDRQIELLKGMAYEGYAVFEWPKLWDASLPEPETILPQASEYLRSRLAAKQAILTAYKGDKRPPKYVERAAP